MEYRRADVARGFDKPRLVVIAYRGPRQVLDRRIFSQRGLPHNFARDMDRIRGNAPILRRREIVRADGGSLRRILRLECHPSAAGGADIGNACRESRKRMEGLAELVERKWLHMILNVGCRL